MKIKYIVLMLTVFLLSGCFAGGATPTETTASTETTAPTPTVTPLPVTYSLNGGKLTLAVPEDWSCQDRSDSQSELLTWACPEGSSLIGASAGTQEGLNSGLFTENYIGSLKNNLPANAAFESSTVSVGSISGTKYQISGLPDGEYYPCLVYLLFDQDDYYAISFITSNDEKKICEDIFMQVAESLAFNVEG